MPYFYKPFLPCIKKASTTRFLQVIASHWLDILLLCLNINGPMHSTLGQEMRFEVMSVVQVCIERYFLIIGERDLTDIRPVRHSHVTATSWICHIRLSAKRSQQPSAYREGLVLSVELHQMLSDKN